MDTELLKLLTQLGIHGPVGAVCIILLYLLMQERKRVVEERKSSAELTAKLLELSRATVQAEGEHNQAYEALSNLYDLGVESAKTNANVVSSLEAVAKELNELKDEVRRSNERPKRG